MGAAARGKATTIMKKLSINFIVLAMLCVSAASAFAADAGFHYLAADPSLRAQTQNVNVTMGKATYVGKVLELDQSWETPFKIVYPGSVVSDPATGQWRMYYELMKSETERFVAMATSDDGVNWTKPALNITGDKYTTDHRNNFVNNTSSQWIVGPSVSIDPNAAADQRYRMSANVYNAPNNGIVTLNTYSSADGLNWHQVGTIQVADWNDGLKALDSQNAAFWDPKTQKYMAQMRYNYRNVMDRGVMMKLNDTWDGEWTAAPQNTIDPRDVFDSTALDIYTPGVVPYFGQYVGLPAIYNDNTGNMSPTFMYSRDGADWSFPASSQSIIDLNPHEENGLYAGMAFPATSLIDKDGWLHIYYSFLPSKHGEPTISGQMHLAKMREDRFVGIESTEDNVGTWTTSNITLSNDPGQLVVNAIVRGSVGVEVLDPLTMLPFAGYAASDCVPITSGDYLHAVSQWNGIDSLDAFAGQTVVLRFTMDDAAIYSFRFESVPEPSAIALLLCSGACLLAFRRWRLLGLASGKSPPRDGGR